jgi:hypothetical protein
MPSSEVMHEFKRGHLHSGKGGPVVTSRDQAIAIKLSEQRKEDTQRAKHKGQMRAIKRMSGEE